MQQPRARARSHVACVAASAALALVLAGTARAAVAPVAADAPWFVIDLHADTVHHALVSKRTIAGPAPKGDLDVPRLLGARYAAQVFAIWVPAKVDAKGGAAASKAWAEKAYAAFERLVASSPSLGHARSAADVAALRAAGRVGAVLSIEGAHALGDDPAALDPWIARGLRLLGLTWNNSNAFAEAAADPRPAVPGLTDAGRALVARAEAAGVRIDVSHASPATVRDVVALARRPVVASHSDCAALRPHARNLDDDALRAIASTGGVVGINFHGPFVSTAHPVTIEHVVDHVLHAVKVAGADHVALGSDFDGLIVKPRGLEGAHAMPALAAALARRGLGPADVAKVMGGNALRVLAAE